LEEVNMYSWGDDKSTWKKPDAYDWGDAAKPYLEDNKKKAKEKGLEERSYLTVAAPDMKLVDPKGKYISSQSKRPIIFGIDLTASTQAWHAEITDRLPLFCQTLQKYDPDVEISFSAVTDTSPNKWPLQVANFAKGVELEGIIKAIYPEGKGGPGIRESYELWGHYMNTHVNVPYAERPLMFLVADEKFYDKINPDHVSKYIGDGLQEPIDSMTMWHELGDKFEMYILRKSYPGRDAEILKQWNEAVGPQSIIPIEYGSRVIDVALGITAKRWGKESDFAANLSARQDETGKSIVYQSLQAADVKLATAPQSMKKLPPAKSIKLLE
jgi:hypothetical protein